VKKNTSDEEQDLNDGISKSAFVVLYIAFPVKIKIT